MHTLNTWILSKQRKYILRGIHEMVQPCNESNWILQTITSTFNSNTIFKINVVITLN